jgi:glycine oxidase
VASADVIVIGAGIVGLSAARALASAGARVLVVERQRVGAEASGAAAGMLAPQVEAEEGSPLLDLALRARDHLVGLVPDLEKETGIGVELSAQGVLEIALGDEEERQADDRLRWQKARGLAVERLTARELRDAEPNLTGAARGALFFPRDRSVDNVRLTRALAASAVARGATLLTGRPVTGLLLSADGAVTGVQAGTEAFEAPVVINAAGAWAGLLPADPRPIAVEPVRGLIVAFELAPPLLRHVVYGGGGYLVPRADGRVLAGSTMERAGFDKSVTAASLRTVLDSALRIAPALADVRIAGAWAGLRPGTPDGLPIIGAGAARGLFHAAGLFRNGILMGPLVGEIVAALARGRPAAVDLAPFAPDRLAAAGAQARANPPASYSVPAGGPMPDDKPEEKDETGPAVRPDKEKIAEALRAKVTARLAPMLADPKGRLKMTVALRVLSIVNREIGKGEPRLESDWTTLKAAVAGQEGADELVSSLQTAVRTYADELEKRIASGEMEEKQAREAAVKVVQAALLKKLGLLPAQAIES